MRYLAILVAWSCYQQQVPTTCTLTCSAAMPCPDELLCNDEGRCVADADTVCRPFTVDQCPASYPIMIAATATTSRYRVTDSATTFWDSEAACAADLPGATHLITPSYRDEPRQVTEQLASNMPNIVWVGAVQDPLATASDGGWVRFDDSAPPIGELLPWSAGEPNDTNGSETDHFENVAIYIRDSQSSNDAVGDQTFGMICECDGTPIGPTARRFVDTDPNHP